ncbi:MAG TPA: methyltransferase [Solimonas sp.]|nr:methyltransferase [Solimonas sp.]
MIPDYYTRDPLTALEAKERAQWIAFAPFVFEATHCLRSTGILTNIEAGRGDGLSAAEVRELSGLSEYGARVLLEAGLAIGLLTERGGRYRTTKTAHFLLNDKLTQVNFDFTRDVNYRGLAHLEQAVREGKPAGLKTFGPWPTIYEGLSQLPGPVRKSWFGFDHYYSDAAFGAVLPHVFRRAPRRLLDIGGNTGKGALACVRLDPAVQVTILDLPGQLRDAARAVQAAGLGHRIDFREANLLDESSAVPGGFDAIWMSQFLDCFSEAQIVSILQRCAAALAPEARVYILEPFWDRQAYRMGAFCLQMTSLYFTAMANGNSQMYRSDTFLACVSAAGLEVEEQIDGLGISHTLLVCRRAGG